MQQARLVFSSAMALAFLGLGSLSAQQQLINKDQVEQFNKIKFPFISKALVGLEPAPATQYELAARYYVCRVTFDQAGDPSKALGQVVKDFEEMVGIATTTTNFKGSREPVKILAPPMVARFKEVFALDWKSSQLAQINAAVMLPHFAKLRADDIGDYLAVVLDDAKLHDAIRVHAAKGLREYMPVAPFTRLDLGQGAKTKQLEDRKTREVKRVDALVKFIERAVVKDSAELASLSPYEQDAIRYLRREAVASLALAQSPAVSSFNGKVEGPVAASLIKVLAKKVVPEPAIGERLEAAIGVCLFTKYVEEYEPKIGIYLAAECFGDLISDYKKDQTAITAKGKNKLPTVLPWKQVAKRVEIALSELVANSKAPNAAAAQGLESRMKPMLKSMANGDNIDREQEFRKYVIGLRPAAGTKVLFRNAKGPMLEVDWETAAADDEK